MSEAAPPATKRSSRKAKSLTVEMARDAILAKVQKGERKGALIPAQKDGAKEAIYVEALAALEAAREVFADRRKAKARFYLWELRPAMPTAESVAATLERMAAARFPLLLAEADLKKALGKDEKSLLEPALAYTVEAGLLLRLEYGSGKTVKPLYASSSAVAQRIGRKASEAAVSTAPPLSIGDAVRGVYEGLVKRTGFRAVNISRLQAESGVGMEALKGWLLEEYRAGRAVLSEGDWSLASDTERAGVIEVQGERCILARLLS